MGSFNNEEERAKVEAASDGFIILHFSEENLPVAHPDQNGHAFGPYPNSETAANAVAGFTCDCNKLMVGLIFPPAVGATIHTDEQLAAKAKGFPLWEHSDGVLHYEKLDDERLVSIMEATTKRDDELMRDAPIIIRKTLSEFFRDILGVELTDEQREAIKERRRQQRNDRNN